MALPALALPAKSSAPRSLPTALTAKFWAKAELLITPAPLISRLANSDDVLMVKGLASGWKTMLLITTGLVRVTFVCSETLNVAISESPFGTVAGVQLEGVFQLSVAGACCHVALPAKARPALPESRAMI